MNELVSIIIPCYNAEEYIEKCLNSLLEQTYENIEIIIIDDGSTDNSQDIIFKYIERNETATKKTIKYFYQNNKGLPGAINKGLSLISGDYFSWGDPDDFLDNNSIFEKMDFFRENEYYSFVRTKVNLIDEIGNVIYTVPDNRNENIFDDLIFQNGIPLTPGNYLLKTKDFKRALPSLTILEGVRGQNWQLLLPMAINYKCGYIDKPLNNYLVRDGSMSHSDKSLSDEYFRCDEHKKIILSTIKDLLKKDEFDKYTELLNETYNKRKFFIALRYNDRNEVYGKYIEQKNKDFKTVISFCIYKVKLFKVILKMKQFIYPSH